MTNTAPDPTPDVGAILEQLRAEVRSRRLARGVAEQDGYEQAVRRALDEIELHRVVSAHWPLTSTSLIGRAVNLVNKLVRRYLRWYINPIVEQQNAANDALARALRLLSEAYLDLAEQVAEAKAGDVATERTEDTERGGPGTGRAGSLSIPSAASVNSVAETGDAQRLVAERGAQEPPARFPDLELRDLAAALRQRPPVSAHWALAGRTPVERAAALHNRVVRQYLRWYINPIVEQQNAANDALAAAVEALARLDAQRRAQVAGLRARRVRGDGASRRVSG